MPRLGAVQPCTHHDKHASILLRHPPWRRSIHLGPDIVVQAVERRFPDEWRCDTPKKKAGDSWSRMARDFESFTVAKR